MKTAIFTIGMLIASIASAQSVYVKPYVKSDGTFVEGGYRSAPNGTTHDNYSSKGNFNPYTGKTVSVEPDDSKSSTYQPIRPLKPYGSK